MLARLNITKWDGKNDQLITDTTTGNVFLFNASNIASLKVRASSKSSLMFVEDIRGGREKGQYLEATQSVANIETYSAYTWQTVYVALPLYPDNDSTQSTVTTYINCESISWVRKDNVAPATKSIVTYFEGSKKRTVLCAYSINQIYSLCNDGDLTTD